MCSNIIMGALWYRAGHYIFALVWFLLSFLFPCLISAVVEWMSIYLYTRCGLSANLECRSEMYCMRLAGNTGRKNDAKSRHLRTIAQLCSAESWQLRHVSTIGKNWLSSNICSTYPYNMVNLRPTSGWDPFVSLGQPSKFQRVSRLGSVTAQPNCGVEQRAPPVFDRAAITLGIGPHF